MWIGTNDLKNSDGATVHSALSTYCAARRAAGWKVVVLTALDRGDSGTASYHQNRLDYNALIRANYTSYADELADVASDPTIGIDGAYNNATYFDADLIHVLPAAKTIVATYVRTALASLGIS